jgi:3-deoxy-D-manno-octulosonic acid kinase
MSAMRPARSERRALGVAVLPADFQKVELGRRLVFLRRDLAPHTPALLASLRKLASAPGAGNRSSGHHLTLADGTELFARMNRRGGLIRRFLSDLYVGTGGRPIRELAVAVEARCRGVLVPEPIGAIVEWVGPLVYRSILLTRRLTGLTLWEFVRTDDDAVVKTHVTIQVRQAIDTMHQRGLFHADLNLHNLFITKARESFAVAILDLDKAQLFDHPLRPWMRARNFARLRQSARKLDPDRCYLDSDTLDLLTRS